MNGFKLKRFSYSPGYSDMRGAAHRMSLRRDPTGRWVLECRDRIVHNEPTTVTTYEVSDAAVEEFESFILKNKVFTLCNRRKGDLFATDYSQWSFGIDYEKKSFGKTVFQWCNFDEYKEYSKRDQALIEELRERFLALRGQQLSKTEEAGD